MLNSVQVKFFFIVGFSLVLLPIINVNAFGQLNQTSDNFDQAKSSSDEALSLIDSLKGSSLLDSVVEDMKNISYPTANQTINNGNNSSQPLENTLNFLISNSTAAIDPLPSNNTTIIPDAINKNTTADGYSLNNIQPIMVLPYPMTISSKDIIPLYSSIPLKIANGNILAKLPCNSTSSILQIAGSTSDGKLFPIQLNLLPNLTGTGSMCMYQSVIPDDLSNRLYSNTLTNIYLYNPLEYPLEVPTTTSIFIGIHKLIE
ncbi:hypothetical protein [Candidatus Nitrosocosmicus franklandus]|uniref:Uncharacterized protein n=1 Tax=Candidatus Nitrosocosmicus franklandianus TaxID=1798806 RepID=A0A484I7M3_9ARCH|nr:hypothetical protein [Candidatus Nitrosocosmicus franklandus]VFJ13749.1 conserved exported protein of unknown function [Candidatus Nitrosocosmicus franklandus]